MAPAPRAAWPMSPCRTARSPPSGRSSAPASARSRPAGLIVAPGFVDIHTHYDGQATWDPFVTPSSWHGVTTTVFGNCGVGFAPVRPGQSGYLINLMEGVEDIPGTVLSEGVKFNWESFPDYLDALGSMTRAVDVAAQLPHGALRFYVMGDRGADHAEVPNQGEREEMTRLVEEALRAGALGVTTSRTTKHKARDGRFTPVAQRPRGRAVRPGRGHEARRQAACCRSIRTSARASSRRSTPRPGSPAGRSPCCWSRSMPSRSCGARRSTRSMACAPRAAPPTRRSARGRSA